MSATADALWARAVRAAGARGLVPASKSLTPAEIAAEVADRGEDRLARLVAGWYYPASYGRVRGTLSDEEARRIVAALEAEGARAEIARAKSAPPPLEAPAPPPLPTRCELCGLPLPQDPF